MNFIREYYIDNLDICDKLIDFFHQDEVEKSPGWVGVAGKPLINKDIKSSTDYFIDAYDRFPAPILRDYVNDLAKCLEEYTKEFSFAKDFGPFAIHEGMRIQWYKPGEGFRAWHTERNNATLPNASRHLVFMTYLNDVNDGGGTEFFHQKLEIKAKKGKTVIWPADWTHTHRGVVSNTEHKYIATGWYNYQME